MGLVPRGAYLFIPNVVNISIDLDWTPQETHNTTRIPEEPKKNEYTAPVNAPSPTKEHSGNGLEYKIKSCTDFITFLAACQPPKS